MLPEGWGGEIGSSPSDFLPLNHLLSFLAGECQAREGTAQFSSFRLPKGQGVGEGGDRGRSEQSGTVPLSPTAL